jgi:hypothetical protein
MRMYYDLMQWRRRSELCTMRDSDGALRVDLNWVNGMNESSKTNY